MSPELSRSIDVSLRAVVEEEAENGAVERVV